MQSLRQRPELCNRWSPGLHFLVGWCSCQPDTTCASAEQECCTARPREMLWCFVAHVAGNFDGDCRLHGALLCTTRFCSLPACALPVLYQWFQTLWCFVQGQPEQWSWKRPLDRFVRISAAADLLPGQEVSIICFTPESPQGDSLPALSFSMSAVLKRAIKEGNLL